MPPGAKQQRWTSIFITAKRFWLLTTIRVAVIMAALLHSVNPIIGRIQIQIDARRDRPLRPEEPVEKELVHLLFSHCDLLVGPIALGIAALEFQPMERAFTGQRFALVRRATPILACHIRTPAP